MDTLMAAQGDGFDVVTCNWIIVAASPQLKPQLELMVSTITKHLYPVTSHVNLIILCCYNLVIIHPTNQHIVNHGQQLSVIIHVKPFINQFNYWPSLALNTYYG